MCPHHRREQLRAVRERLRNGVPVRLIATSLVEAGCRPRSRRGRGSWQWEVSSVVDGQ